jgi:hypothetical protein
MRDRKLEERIELLEEFINEWIRFRNFLKIGAAGKASPEKEEEFMKLKSLIARKYQHLTTLMGESFSADERLMKTVSRVASLKQVAEIKPEVGQRSIEDEWHSSFIRLNENLGNMEGERAKLARVSQIGIVLSWMLPLMRRFLKSLGRAVLTLLVIAAILFVGSYFIWREEGERFPSWARDRATEMGIIHFFKRD